MMIWSKPLITELCAMATDMHAANPLSALKDIHLPEGVSLWPLAPGWYVIIILLLALFIFFGITGVKKYRQIKKRQAIIRLFTALENNYLSNQNNEVLSEISILLKKIAIMKFPHKNPERFYGEKWLLFLDETGKTKQFTSGIGRLLMNSYKPKGNEDLSGLFPVLHEWLRRVL